MLKALSFRRQRSEAKAPKKNVIDRDDEYPTIRVIAPANLPEGSSFDVHLDDGVYTVCVPKGGVKDGQEFEVLYEEKYHQIPGVKTMPTHEEDDDEESYRKNLDKCYSEDGDKSEGDENSEDEDAIWYDSATGAPIGQWRHKMCSCCDVVTQSTFWMGLCCTPILIAQLVTRFGLTWNGQVASSPEEASLSFNRIVVTMMIFLAIWKIPILGGFALFFYWMFIVGKVGSSLRQHVRQKYKIEASLPTRFAERFDDFCCMMCCGSCSAIQIARHTHDDKDYPGHGCTTTGLGIDAPAVV